MRKRQMTVLATGIFVALPICVSSATFVNQAGVAGVLPMLSVGFQRLAIGSRNPCQTIWPPRPAVGAFTSIQKILRQYRRLAPLVTSYIIGNTGFFVSAMVIAGAWPR